MSKAILVLLTPVLHALLIDFLPPNDQYIIEGESLNLTCIVTGQSHSIPGPLVITQYCLSKNCSNHHAVSYTSNIVHLLIKKVRVSDSGTYECKKNDSLYAYLSVKVGYLPEKPELFCYSIDFMNMTCEVKTKFNPLPTAWSLFYSTGGSMIECLGLKTEEHVCEWYSYHDKGYTGDVLSVFEFNVEAYYITVEIRNRAKADNFSYIVKPSEIVKPSKIVNLRHGRVYSRQIYMLWNIQPLLAIFKIQYSVTFKSKWDNTQREKSFHNKGNVSLTIELTDLLPNTAYSVTVRCKSTQSNGHRYWSEPSTVLVMTDMDVPGASPSTLPGAYYLPSQPTGNNTFVAYLYMQDVPKILHNSDSMFYEVVVNSIKTNDTSEAVQYTAIQRTPSTAQILINDDDADYYLAYITACNEKGCTETKSRTIVIPAKQRKEYPRASDVVVESYRPGQYFISWSLEQSAILRLEKVIYVWCKANNSDKICYKDVSLKEVLSNTQNVSITASHHRDLVFGVSLVYKDGMSPGITFSECNFLTYDGDTDPGTPNFKLISGNDKIIIFLQFGFCDSTYLKSLPEFYKVYYKTSTENSNCTEDVNVVVIKAMRNITEVIIDSLDPGQYCVRMMIETRLGTSPMSSVHYVTLEGLESPDIRSFVEQILLSCSLCLVIIIAALTRYFYTKWKSIDAEIEDIKIPVQQTENKKSCEKSVLDGVDDRDSGLVDTSAENDKEAMVKLLQTHLPYVSVDENSFSGLFTNYRKNSASLESDGNIDNYVLADMEYDDESQPYVRSNDPDLIVLTCLFDHLAENISNSNIEDTSCQAVSDPVYTEKFKMDSDSSSSSSSSSS